MAIEIKGSTIADVIAAAKAKAEAYAKLSPEERAEQDKKTAEILKKLGPNGPTVLRIRPTKNA